MRPPPFTKRCFQVRIRAVNIRLCFGAGLAVWFLSAAGLSRAAAGERRRGRQPEQHELVQLGNYYCERRGVPPQNLLRINWTGGNTSWSRSDFRDLPAPIHWSPGFSSRGLTNQVDYVVLSMDIPYQVTAADGINSTTAAVVLRFQAGRLHH